MSDGVRGALLGATVVLICLTFVYSGGAGSAPDLGTVRDAPAPR
jgi:hypothetical protein